MNICLRLIFFALFTALPILAAQKKDKEETPPPPPPVTYKALADYAKLVLETLDKEQKPTDEYTGKKLETVRGRVNYVNKNSGQCYYLLQEEGWNFFIEFTPEKIIKPGAMLTINGVIKKISVFGAQPQSDKTVYIVLDTTDKKAVAGRSSGKLTYGFEDFARIGNDYYSLPEPLREKLPLPVDEQIEAITRSVYSTNKETRTINLREVVSRWEITMQLRTTEKVSQKSLIEVKKATIGSMNISRQGATRIGKIKIELNGDFDVVKDSSAKKDSDSDND